MVAKFVLNVAANNVNSSLGSFSEEVPISVTRVSKFFFKAKVKPSLPQRRNV
jgi:hypothetical protein